MKYLEGGGEGSGMEITEFQQNLLERWKFAASKLGEQKYKRSQITKFLMATFKISRDTAFRDIVNAEYVFSISAPINKMFFAGQRMELLQQQIREAYIDKDRMGAAMLERQLIAWFKEYPDFVPAKAPGVTIYKLTQNNITVNAGEQPMSINEAEAEADKLIQDLEADDEQ